MFVVFGVMGVDYGMVVMGCYMGMEIMGMFVMYDGRLVSMFYVGFVKLGCFGVNSKNKLEFWNCFWCVCFVLLMFCCLFELVVFVLLILLILLVFVVFWCDYWVIDWWIIEIVLCWYCV